MVCTPRVATMFALSSGAILPCAQTGNPESLPEKRKKREAVQIVLAAAVFHRAAKRFYCPRLETKQRTSPRPTTLPRSVSKMWHFPTLAIRRDPLEELRNIFANFFRPKMERSRLEPLQKCATR